MKKPLFVPESLKAAIPGTKQPVLCPRSKKAFVLAKRYAFSTSKFHTMTGQNHLAKPFLSNKAFQAHP